MPTELQGVLFDFDGVVVDSEPIHYAAFRDVMHPLGVAFSYADYMNELIGYDDRDAFAYLLKKHGLTRPSVAELCAEKQPAFDRICANGIAPIPGSVPLIDALNDAGVPIAVASGATRADIDLILAGLDRSDAFRVIVTADDVERSKPDPATYARAAQRLGVDPAACWAIEDTRAGLASARAAGARTIALTTTHPADDLLPHADRVLENLQGVTPADLRTWFAGPPA